MDGILNNSNYDFLKEKPLGDNIILLGLGGSWAYGNVNKNIVLNRYKGNL